MASVRDDAREIESVSSTTATQDDEWFFRSLAWADVGVEAPEGYDFEVARQKLAKHLAEVEKHASSTRSALE